jgi:L-aspartate oxidase
VQSIDTDVLVVGAGIAGLTVALSAGSRRVTVLATWAPPGGTASAMAQGGIAAAVGADDSPRQHEEDTLRAGAGACDPDAVRILCGDAREAIAWLESRGVEFDKEGEGALAGDAYSLHREAAHSRARVLHVQHDRTGFGIMRALARTARATPNLDFLKGLHAVALSGDAQSVSGVIAIDRNGQPVQVRAADVVLATGGLGHLFAQTTNPRNACGDGLAMALAAGAQVSSLEFVQFHPTALAVDADPMPLLTEALRGAGARLVDSEGRDFMRELHPAGSLAPRDVVARGVASHLRAGQHAFLDAREVFARKPGAFPSIRQICANHHLDPARTPLPIAPAAHYHMGGVDVDLDGRSSLDRLWACGEVACTGAHGANRLASNSLLEGVVFGRRLARALDRAARPAKEAKVPLPAGREAYSLDVDEAIFDRLRRLMWSHAGIVRSEAGLADALARLAEMRRAIPPGQIQLENRVRLAIAMVTAARTRTASLGAHFRSDDLH